MARIIYALSGQGRGHTSRVIAITEGLRRGGHEVIFCCGGTAQEILASQGERVVPVPALRQVLQCNEVQLGRTMSHNWKHVLRLPETTRQLADTFAELRPDLLITDFEAFSPRAARRVGVPVVSFNHQQVVTETRYPLPIRYWLDAAVTAMAIRCIAPRRPAHLLLTSFFFPPCKDPLQTTLVPPVIRPAVQALHPTEGNHVLVYYNQTEGAEYVLETLRQVNASFILYNFPRPDRPEAFPNLQFKSPSLKGFLEDLATSRAVICTAGFTLISEALYLGKPLLVVPNRGIFEQTINALFLQRDGLGEAVINRPLTAADVTGFLSRRQLYQTHLRGRRTCGNKEAVACIEGVLSALGPSRHPRPALPAPSLAQPPVPAPAAKPD